MSPSLLGLIFNWNFIKKANFDFSGVIPHVCQTSGLLVRYAPIYELVLTKLLLMFYENVCI